MTEQGRGWYQDPWGQAPYRWWDGTRWTDHTQGLVPPTEPPVSADVPPLPHSTVDTPPQPWWRTGWAVVFAVAVVVIIGLVNIEPSANGPDDLLAAGPPEQEQSAEGWLVDRVVDGDTVDVRQGAATERVRVIGIDTPERGECGFEAAATVLASLVLDEEVVLTSGARNDRDRYDRILRYIDIEGMDAGLYLIQQGLAIARYDSRDGYGRHPREEVYVAADHANEHECGLSGLQNGGQTQQSPGSSSSGAIKKSRSAICHAPGTTYYSRTTNYTSYNTLEECLESGGRLPRSGS